MDSQSSVSRSSEDGEQTRWFMDEVHPHGSSLKAYLHSSFPTVRDVDDVMQEAYIRLLKARAVYPIKSVRAFLFSVARRLAIDVIRKERRTTANEIVMDLDSLGVLENKADAAETSSTHEEIALLAQAIHSLPARCRKIMIMRKLDRLPQHEIARRLGIAVSTVEVQIFRGMAKCTRYLRSRGVDIDSRGNPS